MVNWVLKAIFQGQANAQKISIRQSATLLDFFTRMELPTL
jgi:hypothetical protein